ncbi:serpin family protein [Paenibacillus allorhizosphaerae]|uniref:Serpin domain-containing protein n=1 Tax=Paenibacillus allorhizosphaerae TaxID=2849866 RepID=A0ABN7TR57_9BACL|nr:serpin family protein [Paenibacillus allorhizosphaerae]CAG7647553.1 hypothetical protein PAECIP111802_04002 [Paenibacillus allorhizosphaerae]
MLKNWFLPVMAAVLVLCSGCSEPAARSMLAERSYKPSELDSRIVQASNAFGLRLHQAAVKAKPDANVFLSPASVSMALTMAYNGAGDSTREAMAKALQLQGLPIDDINRAERVWKDLLEHQGAGVQLSIANSLWTRKGKPLLEGFLQKNREYYGAEVIPIDFASSRAAGTINSWVKKHTNGKIERIVDDKPDEQTMLMLVNAVWFKGQWTRPFHESATVPGSFFTSPGASRQVPMMVQSGSFEYMQEAGFQAVRLPYGKEENMAMLLFLPEEGAGLDSLQSKLWNETELWNRPFPQQQGVLELPRFKMEYGERLNDTLKSLGMSEPFDPLKADFSGMAPVPPRFAINEVIHKTYVDVNEKGTEAAAVTSVGMAGSAPPKDKFRMTVNRPFVMAIQDRETGSLLFLGTVRDPVS